jgi:hypothetical protein
MVEVAWMVNGVRPISVDGVSAHKGLFPSSASITHDPEQLEAFNGSIDSCSVSVPPS